MRSGIKWLFGLASVFCIGACVGMNGVSAGAEMKASNEIAAKVTEVNNERLDNGIAFVMLLSANDYMTADGWSHSNYLWANAEEITDREGFDFSANNLANAQLDRNLEQYNFEEYILIDGVTLADFAKTHTYSMFANKRTRPNTLSIDFAPGVLENVDTIEIKEGCQLPTMTYSYLGEGEFSCIEIQESVVYENRDGAWLKYFKGYEEGTEYAAVEDFVKANFDTAYKGHTAVPLDSFTNFFTTNAVQGETLTHSVLVSVSNTEKGNLMVLNFVNPIDAEEFNRLNLRVYINHQVDVLTYNADAITESDLGPALESYTVGGGQYSYLALNSALYADENGEVSTIVFQFAQDCEPQRDANGNILYGSGGKAIRDTFHFVSFNLTNAEAPALVSKDAFMVVDGGDAYDLTFRFGKSGASGGASLDLSKVALNGVTLDELISKCEGATAEWYSARGIYQINVSLPKSYIGEGQIKNAEYAFAGNNMSVLEGLTFPNGDVLKTSYTCHLYAGEKIVDKDLVKSYNEITVENVQFSFVDGTNLNFSIYFSGAITTSLYNHACEIEHWRTDEETSEKIKYDKSSSDIFVVGGYKSALLDKVVVNGLTIGEWHALKPAALTSVQVHYGVALEMNRMDVRFESATSDIYNPLYDLVVAGNGITIEVLPGLKFTTNNATAKAQTFAMVGGEFIQQAGNKGVHVYYNGTEVQDGESIMVRTYVSEASIAVEGVVDYTVSRADVDGKKVYTVTYGENTLTFTVVEDVVAVEKAKEKGCSSSLGVGFVGTLLAACAALAVCAKGGKKNEEQ